MKRAIMRLALAAVLWIPASANASIIYTNIDPGFPNDASTGAGAPVPTGIWAQLFTAAASGTLTNIVVGAYSDFNGNPVTFGLYTNSSNEPGTLLESWSFNVPTGNTVLGTIPSVVNPSLTAGSQYWLVASGPNEPELQWTLSEATTGGQGSGTTLTGISIFDPTELALGIQLNGVTLTPEPGTLALLAIACLALPARRHRPKSTKPSVQSHR